MASVSGYQVGGTLVRAWTPQCIRAEIATANIGINAALRAGDMDTALTLISRKVGLRVCAGEIKVHLKSPRHGSSVSVSVQRPHAARPAR